MALPQSKPSTLNLVPWSLLIIGYLLFIHFSGLDMKGVAGYVFIGLGVVVLFAEFFKSGDISPSVFFFDLVSSIISLVLATALLCVLYFKEGQLPTFYHWFGFAIIIGDALLSPFNAFRTALRNIGLGT